MTNVQLHRASDVLAIWPLFDEGFGHLASAKELYYNELQAKKFVCKMATEQDSGYVAVVFSDDGEPLAFCVFQENTLPFSNYRTFISRALYYRQGNSSALGVLFGAFEQWCTQHGVRRYAVVTRRHITAAKRTFANEKYGFNKMLLVFEKVL